MKLEEALSRQFECREVDGPGRVFQMISNGEVAATLRFGRGCGSPVVGEFGPQRWCFQRRALP